MTLVQHRGPFLHLAAFAVVAAQPFIDQRGERRYSECRIGEQRVVRRHQARMIARPASDLEVCEPDLYPLRSIWNERAALARCLVGADRGALQFLTVENKQQIRFTQYIRAGEVEGMTRREIGPRCL